MRQDDLVQSRRDAIEQAYREDSARLWRSLLGYTGSADVASDALAEAYAQALSRDGDLRVPCVLGVDRSLPHRVRHAEAHATEQRAGRTR